MAEKKKPPFRADRVVIEAAEGGYVIRGNKDGDGTPRNPWREGTMVASTWPEAQEAVKEFLNAPEG